MTVLLEVNHLKKYFQMRTGPFKGGKVEVRAVDGISFRLEQSETLGLAGESGSGKTTVGKIVLGLLEPTAGSVSFRGRDMFALNDQQLREVRREMGIVFQDPTSSLNPRKTLRQILSVPYRVHTSLTKDEVESRVLELLDKIGFGTPHVYMDKYPYELSGGQRQRVGIGRAMALHPKLIVADEPVSSLDVSIRGQILNLMKKLQEENRVAYLFIAHDLTVIRSMCIKVAIMYLGKIVELADTRELYENPIHPYTQALFAVTPVPDPRQARARKLVSLKGEIPSPVNPPPGCRFHPRCPHAMAKCAEVEPEFIEVTKKHYVACHLQ